jgi:hypothetical protein
MATQDFMGRGQLLQRLTAQVGDEKIAKDLLIKRGHMNPDGSLTPAGHARNNMTAEERAKDRAAKATGGSVHAFTYNPKTNSVRKR